MFKLSNMYSILLTFVTVSILLLFPRELSSHCDGLDGPVVTAARKALETGDINLVLIWVQKDDEAEIKDVFDHTLKVRKLSHEARKLADTFFFETLVRVHRAGEGAPYTGLKPAGRDLGPAIAAADGAVETGSAKHLLRILNEAVQIGIHQRFVKVQKLKDFDKANIQVGREFVKAYVDFLHFVEPIYEMATKTTGHDNADSSAHEVHVH